MRRFLILALNFFAICSFATQQQIDTVYYKGMESSLYPWPLPTPLELLFKYKEPEKNPFYWCNTGNYRGHIAVWEISSDKLYLNRVYASCEERKYSMSEIFGDTVRNEPIVASWFTGFLAIESYPKKELEFEHKGKKFFNITYAKTVLLEIEKGVVLGQYEYEPYIYGELLNKHQMLNEIPTEQQGIFDRRRDYNESLYGSKYVRQQARRREKLLKKRSKESNNP